MQQPRPSPQQVRVIVAMHDLGDRHGAVADTSRILALMAALVPERPEIIAAQARNLMFAKNYAEARGLLQKAEADHPRHAVIKAMLAMCMYIQQDGLWEAYAEEALALPKDAIARGIIEAVVKSSGKTLLGLASPAEAPSAAPYAFTGLAC